MNWIVFVLCFAAVKSDLFTKRHDFPFRNLDRDLIFDFIDVIDMPVDHFNPFDFRTFEMRYSCNSEFYNGTGPLLLYIAGEASLEGQIGAINIGLMHSMGEDLGGYLCIIEHRYYGNSIPEYNLETSNMEYLTFDQVLADLAYFIRNRKWFVGGLEKVVVVGGSYPGSLSAWMRLKYPNLVDAAVSSSAVMNLKVDNYEYNEIVQREISHNESCLRTLKNGILAMKNYTKTKDGRKKLRYDLNLCEPLQPSDKLSIQNLFDNIVVMIGNIVQYNNQGIFMTIDKMCDVMLQNETDYDDYTRLARFILLWNALYAHSQCILSYRSTVGVYRITGANNGRSWLYQMCSQLGFFVTTDAKDQLYSNTVPLSYWYSICQDVFGSAFNPGRIRLGVERSKEEFGGLNVTKVVFTVGTADPVSGVGLREGLNDEAPLIKIENATHCMDLTSPLKTDSPALISAREEIKRYVYSWLR